MFESLEWTALTVSHCNSSLQGLSENPSYANVVFLKVDVDDAQVSFVIGFFFLFVRDCSVGNLGITVSMRFQLVKCFHVLVEFVFSKS